MVDQKVSCPNCGTEFRLEDAGYAELLKQVKNKEFQQEIENELELKTKQLELNHQEKSSIKDQTIKELQAKAAGFDTEKQLAVKESTLELEKKLDRLSIELKEVKKEKQTATELTKANLLQEFQEQKAKDNMAIQELKTQIATSEKDQQLAVTNAINEIEKQREQMKADFEKFKLQSELEQKALKEQHEKDVKTHQEEIQRVQDMKAKLSTKMVGETLEQHCEIEFNRIRPTAFPSADFHKDSDIKSGTKGDYIFRDYDNGGNEIVSIMFEMKNENEVTATKKKNEDFLDKLNKDRINKNCEYAVLVSMLEADNELYNTGIVEKSHRYPKMYVIRPQFFIPIISLLRNASLKSLEYKNELALMKSQEIDVSKFEEKWGSLQESFNYSTGLAKKQFETAIKEIDKSILHMEKTKEQLTKSIRNLNIANNKAQDVTIRKLTHGNPTMQTRFKEVKKTPDDSET